MTLKASDVLADLKIDLRPRRLGKRERMLEELLRAYVAEVEAALLFTFDRHGGAAQFARTSPFMRTVVYPPHVDPADAVANAGQPDGWKQGVISVQVITVCDKSTCVVTDIESVRALEANRPGSHV